MTTRTLLLLALALGLLAPGGVARAASARRVPEAETCTGTADDGWLAEGKRRLVTVGQATTGQRILRRQGAAGCRLLGEWVLAGAPGADEDQRAEARSLALRAGEPWSLEMALELAWDREEEVRWDALRSLVEQLPVLTLEEAEVLLGSPHEDARRAAIAIVVGVHWVIHIEVETKVVAVVFVPIIVGDVDVDEVEFWMADYFPPEHEPLLERLVADPEPEIREWTAAAMGRAMMERMAGTDAFGAHLLTLVRDPDHDAAHRAADSVGMGGPPNALEILERMGALEDETLFEDLLDGIDDCLDRDLETVRTAEMAAWVAEHGPERYRAKAERLARRARSELGE